MKASEYRQQYQRQLELTSQKQTNYRDFLDKSQPVAARLRALNSTSGLRNEEEVAQTIDIISDKEENLEIRASALQAISINIGDSSELIDRVLNLLGEDTESPELRLSALKVLQQLSFSSVIFKSKRPEYLATLRPIIDDKDTKLRQQAIKILAINKDEYVQRRLLDQLRGHSKALIGISKAIQMLGYDIHAEHYPILKDILRNPPSRAAKKEAVRLLSADPSSKEYLTEILKDKSEHSEVRKISAAALQSLSPEEFADQAKEIVLDDDDDDDLRATCVNALDQFANPTSLNQDTKLNKHIKNLQQKSTSRQLKRAVGRFISKHSD